MDLDTMPFKILFSKLKDQISDEYISDHFLKVEVKTTEIECNASIEDWNDPLNLKAIFKR